MSKPVAEEVDHIICLVDSVCDCAVQLEDIYDDVVEQEMEIYRKALRTHLTTLLTRLRAAEEVVAASKKVSDAIVEFVEDQDGNGDRLLGAILSAAPALELAHARLSKELGNGTHD